MFFCSSCTNGYAIVAENATWGRCEKCNLKTRLNKVVVWDKWEILDKRNGNLACVLSAATNSPFGGITEGYVAYNPRTKEVIY